MLDISETANQQTSDAMEERIVLKVTEKLVPVLTEKLQTNLFARSQEDTEDNADEGTDDDEDALRTAALNRLVAMNVIWTINVKQTYS